MRKPELDLSKTSPVSTSYERPVSPGLHVMTVGSLPDEGADEVIALLKV